MNKNSMKINMIFSLKITNSIHIKKRMHKTSHEDNFAFYKTHFTSDMILLHLP